jgi:hypothetical protein
MTSRLREASDGTPTSPVLLRFASCRLHSHAPPTVLACSYDQLAIVTIFRTLPALNLTLLAHAAGRFNKESARHPYARVQVRLNSRASCVIMKAGCVHSY